MPTNVLSTVPPRAIPVDRALAQARTSLRGHRLYGSLRNKAHLRTFMEHHVVCVLDFMSLLKSLQRDLTCAEVPWVPTPDPDSARLIQQIVVDEESDVRADGRVQSHFVWYLEAMREVGADSRPIETLVEDLRRGRSLAEALDVSTLPGPAREFGRVTASFLSRSTHVRAAVFFHGREEIIPEMFLPIVDGLAEQGVSCDGLREYLTRHIEVDGGDHGPLAERMLMRLYGGDRVLRAEAESAALESLGARERLWDAIADTCS